jgi:hypothetical protein
MLYVFDNDLSLFCLDCKLILPEENCSRITKVFLLNYNSSEKDFLKFKACMIIDSINLTKGILLFLFSMLKRE